MSRFTYLHLHTHFSRDGGPATPAQWCRAAAEMGYKTLGVSDRGPLVAFPAFSKAARESGIQPVYGMVADIRPPATKGAKADDAVQPAAFFARDRRGLDNLARLASIAYARWPKEAQALDWEAIAKHSAGLALVLLGAVEEVAGDLAGWGAKIRECFDDAAYVGLIHPGQDSSHKLVEKVVAAAEQMQLPAVAMPAARYIRSEDKLSYQALQVARRRAGWTDDAYVEAEVSNPGTGHLLSPDDAADLYAQWPEALENAARLAEACAGVGYLDEVAAEMFQGTQQSERSRLQSLVEERLRQKLGAGSLPDGARDWLDDELAAYENQNALPAWSALASVCDMARSRDGRPALPLGAPLGTADGSLLAYALGISPISPLDYPRPSWLAPGEGGAAGRVLPVPGVELPANSRDELLATLARDYRAALAACHIEIDPLTALSAASEVLDGGGDIRSLALQAMALGWNALADEQSADAEHATLSSLALSLRGAPITFKPDPDMLLVAPMEAQLPTWLPVLQRGEGRPVDWVPIAEEAVAEMRLPAVTLRPSSTLAALAGTLAYAAQYPVPRLAVEGLDLTGWPQLSDKATNALAKGELVGIPYLSASAVKGWKGDITPSATAAIIARSASTRKPPAAPTLDQWTEKTADTGGALLYRDQFEALVTATSGLSPAEAYRLRALLLKESADEAIIAIKERFEAGCAEHGLDAETTEALWQALAASAPDLQSRCSIAVRARTALWAAFFKAEHPAAFLAAHLSANIDREIVPVPALVSEARRLKVGIKPPDASHSMPLPTLERGGSEWTILWGLARLPGWTRDIAARFVAARPKGGFRNMADFALTSVEAGLTPDQLETLVRAGACDTLGGQARSHDALLAALPEWSAWATLERANKDDAGPADLFSFNDAQPSPPPDEKATLGNTPATPRERYLRRTWEVERLGVAFTPAGEIESLKRTLDGSHLRSRLLRSVQVCEEHVGKSVNLVGLLTCIRLVKPPASHAASPGDQMAVAWVEDTEGTIELVAFPPGYKRHAELWAENSLVIVTGRVRKHSDGDIYLLCEHMAAFEGTAEEAEISVKVRQSKKAQAALEEVASPANASSGNGANGKDNGNGAYPANTHSPAIKPTIIPPTPTTAPSATPVTAATMTNTATTTTGGPPAHKIIITLPITEDDKADIDRMISLKGILQEHPGTDVVTLRIPFSPEPGHLTTAQLPRGVSYSAVLEAEVVRLLGTEAIAVIRL